jgi:hypothetical protein
MRERGVYQLKSLLVLTCFGGWGVWERMWCMWVKRVLGVGRLGERVERLVWGVNYGLLTQFYSGTFSLLSLRSLL